MIDSEDNNAAAIISAARELGKIENAKPTREKIGSLEVLVHQNGNVVSLERFSDRPRRKRAVVNLYETASFTEYVNTHKVAGHTHLFGKATELGGSFTAVLDYHGQEKNPTDPQVNIAGWGEHKAVLTLETTPEWGRWIANNAKLMPQEAFAEFIEDNLSDITFPFAADVLEMAQGLVGKKHVAFKSGKNLKDGSIQLEYTEQIEVQGSTNRRDDNIRVPDKITLGIVPFVGAEGVEIDARLRFRIGNDGKLGFAYILNRPYKVIEEAFNLARDIIEQKTGVKVALGSATIPTIG